MHITRILLLCLVMCGTAIVAQNNDSTSVAALIYKGEKALEAELYDSALVSFFSAHRAGMSSDSFYYYLSEYYLQRGVLDSAIALNFAVSVETSDELFARNRQQRYLIYSLLGWDDKANLVIDSFPAVFTTGELSNRHFLWDVTVQLGFRESIDKTPGNAEWTAGSSSQNAWLSGMYQEIETDVSYGRTIAKINDLRIGLEAEIARDYRVAFSAPDQAKQQWYDSLSYKLSPYLSMNNIFNHLSLTYQFGLNRTWYHFLRYSHQWSLLLPVNTINASWLGYAGFELDTDTNSTSYDKSYWLGLNRYQKKHLLWNAGLSVNGYASEPYTYYDNAALQLYARDARMQNPGYYTDATMTTPIDTTVSAFPDNIADYAKIKERILSSADLLTLAHEPVSFIASDLQAGVSKALSQNWKIGFGAGWRTLRYFEEHRWLEFSESLEEFSYYVYSAADDMLYILPGESNAITVNGGLSGRPVTISPVPHAYPAVEKRRRRKDNTIYIDGEIQRKWKRAGTVLLEGGYSRTWSTLQSNTPFRIPLQDWSVGITWNVALLPR